MDVITQQLNIQIDESTFRRLVSEGQLPLNDYRCLDINSKNLIKNIYLDRLKSPLTTK